MDREFISFPKSGRSWIRYALHRLGVADQIFFHHDGFEYNDALRPPLDFDFERRLRRYETTKRIVYMQRDPRDVMVSFYFQITGRFADFFHYRGSISDFIRDPYFGAENLKNFCSQWAKLCAQGRALQISYEDCHSDFEGTLAKVVSHFGFCVDKAAISAAKTDAEFANMQKIESSGVFDQPWLQARNGARKVRKGRVGGFEEELTASDIAYLNNLFFAEPQRKA